MWVERWDRFSNDQKIMSQEKYYIINSGHKFHQNLNYRRHGMGEEGRTDWKHGSQLCRDVGVCFEHSFESWKMELWRCRVLRCRTNTPLLALSLLSFSRGQAGLD